MEEIRMETKGKSGSVPFAKGFVDSIKRNGGIVIGLLIICVILTVMSDSFLSLQNFANIMRQITVNVMAQSQILWDLGFLS